MTTARNHIATSDELAAAIVTKRLMTFDDIGIRYDRLVAPYGVDDDERMIVLPDGLTWQERHSRINRCWLYLIGGVELAPEFAPIVRDSPDRRVVSRRTVTPMPILRRVW